MEMRALVLALLVFSAGCEVDLPDTVTYVNTGDEGHNSDNTDTTTADNSGEVER
jgi:plastocyanin